VQRAVVLEGWGCSWWLRWRVVAGFGRPDRGKFAEEILRWQSARTLFQEVLMRSLSLLSCFVVLCGLVLGASSSEARASRVNQIPNGSQANCLACHVSGGGGARNSFGAQVDAGFMTASGAAGAVVWGPALAALDADGDGYTNGEELGDPTGAWRPGNPNPTLLVATLPGYASCASTAGTGANCARCGGSAGGTQNCPDPCGDNSTYTAAGEVCDGSDVGGATCVSLGFASGSLGCSAACDEIDTLSCVAVPEDVCGDATRTGAEVCDGRDLGGASCVTEGFDGGTLTCDDSCSGLVTTECITLPTDVCGDGTRTGPEICDAGDLGGATCVSRGYTAGTLLCGGDCTFDEAFCNQCGDGAIGGSEACDGSNLGGATCEGQGFAGGTIACAGCGLDTSGCTLCGNDTRDGSETCDGSDLGGVSCETLGFTGGTLGCVSGCLFDTSGCVGTVVDVCGDGVATGSEVCDNTDLNGGSCGSLGFVSGTLGCGSDCTFETASCSRCGDGVLDAEESCDGTVPAELACTTEGFAAGTLGCTSTCELDVAACTLCGNGAIDTGEVCDGSDFGATSCGSLGLGEGSLACLATCVIDTAGCAVAPVDVCGDGAATADESCDGDDLLGLSCDALGFASGTLVCATDCTLDTAACVAPETDTGVAVDAGTDSSTDTGSEDTTATPPSTKAKADEGCSAAGGGSWSWLALLGLLALARRRRA
jgi:hypothetical protein